MAQGAKIRGASKIIGVDTNPEKYEKGMLSIRKCSTGLWIPECSQKLLNYFLLMQERPLA